MNLDKSWGQKVHWREENLKLGTNNPKLCMEPQKTLNSQSNLEKEEQSWRHNAPDLKLYYKAIVTKRVW